MAMAIKHSPHKTQAKKSPLKELSGRKKKTGGDLLSHNLHAVPSTLENLTTEFGMGSGVTSLLQPPVKSHRLIYICLMSKKSDLLSTSQILSLKNADKNKKRRKKKVKRIRTVLYYQSLLHFFILKPGFRGQYVGSRKNLLPKYYYLIPELLRKRGGQVSRLISIGKLNTLPCLHLQPIEVVVFNLPSED